jgi:hypothetical protein
MRLNHHNRAQASLAAAFLLVALVAAPACQESLPLHTSGVLWRCASNSDCNASTFCGPQNICIPNSAIVVLPDVSVPDVSITDTAPDEGPDADAPDALGDAETIVVLHDDNPYGTTDATTGFVLIGDVPRAIYTIVPFFLDGTGDAIALRYACDPDIIEMQVFLDAAWPNGSPTGLVRIIREGGRSYEATGATVSAEAGWYAGSGTATEMGGDGATLPFEFRASRTKRDGVTMRFGADAPIKLADNEVLLDGAFTDEAYTHFEHLIAEHPKVNTVVFGCWMGLAGGNLQLIGKQLRQRDFNTRIMAGSRVASGWLFIAGKQRVLDPGVTLLAEGAANDPAAAIFETGPWVDVTFGNVVTNATYACPSHQVHDFQLPYFKTMLGDAEGEAFYCWTLKDEFNNRVTEADLEPYGVFTPK